MSKKKSSENNEELIRKDERHVRVQQDDEVERAREFWQKNRTGIIGGVVLGIGIVLGYNFWQSHKQTTGQNASIAYEQLVKEQDLAKQKTLHDDLVNNYGGTIYASMSTLQLAKNAVESRDFESAQNYLTTGIAQAKDEAMLTLMQVRLAQVYLQQEKYDDVISLLKAKSPIGFAAQFQELLGDAYAGKGEIDNAKTAYEKGIEILSEQGSQGGLLELKLQNLK